MYRLYTVEIYISVLTTCRLCKVITSEKLYVLLYLVNTHRKPFNVWSRIVLTGDLLSCLL